MPQHLREQLTAASKDAGRSLNAELVHRLERSLEEDARAARRRRPIRLMKGDRMRPRIVWRRPVVAIAIVSLLALSAAAFMLRGSTTTTTAAPVEAEGGPPALTAHLAKLAQALPPDGGMSEEGPGGAAASEFRERAYPDATISLAEMNGARSAFADTAGVPFRAGEGDGRWRSIGPSEAVYPSSQFLNSLLYVPNEYVAGGRTTSIALGECKKNSCEAYITPAGGGVWHTKDILKKKVKWDYLGGPLGINAAGSVAVDPNDEDTVYVGTGEANICGSGCVAGTGLYRSKNGGKKWELLGKTEFAGKGIGQIAVKPGDPNTIYVASTTALAGMSSVCCTGVTRPVPGIAKWGLYKSTNGGQLVELHPQRRDERRPVHRRPERVQQPRNLLAARRQGRGARPVELEHRLRDVLRARRLALE